MLNPVRAATLEQMDHIRHGFFTKEGGVSDGIYASLNCGRGSDDKTANVNENRRRVATCLGATHPDIITPYQVHSPDVFVADKIIDPNDVPKADAVVTSVRGLAVGVLTADCTPVLFAAADTGIVGAAHAGWRGATTGVLEATVQQMERLGANRNTICAAIGPCIHQSAYEVGPEFESNLIAQSSENAMFFKTPIGKSRAHFDLPAYVNHRLQHLDISIIECASLCTYSNESKFFSYRRTTAMKERDYGRQIAAILVT